LEFRHLFDIRYGKTLPKTEISDSGPYPVYGAGDVIGFYDKMLCPNKCALVTSRGNGSGTVWRTREAAFVTNNSLVMLPQEDRRHWDYSFVELLLKHANVMEAKTGSAQPQVTIENLNYVKAIVPTKLLVEKFCAIATPIYEQVDLLYCQIQNLRRTRDLLLPRLLSGQANLENRNG
jgi:type I restriction enzyme S subunit